MKRCLSPLIVFLLVGAFSVSAETLSDAQNAYLSGYYEEALRTAQSLPESEDSLYFSGLVCIKTSEYLQARIYFNRLLAKFPQSKNRERALVKIGDTFFLEENYGEAGKVYASLERKFSASNQMPLIYLRLAQIASKTGDWDSRKTYLDKLRQKYPGCAELAFADRIEGYGDFFTLQVGAFGQEANALSIKRELEPKYPVYIAAEDNLYKVRVGKYSNRDQAKKVYLELLDLGYPARIYP